MGDPKPDVQVELIIVPLPFKVFVRDSNGKLTLKAGFPTDTLAGAWAIGMTQSTSAECRIFEDRDGEFVEITYEALKRTADALNLEISKPRKP